MGLSDELPRRRVGAGRLLLRTLQHTFGLAGPREGRPGPLQRAWRSLQLADRLLGLALVLVGIAIFYFMFVLWRAGPSGMPGAVQPPPGLPAGSTLAFSPWTCVIFVGSLGAVALVFEGLRRLWDPRE